MLWFKCCPRCRGDLYEDRDRYGAFIACVQCGYMQDTTSDTLAALVTHSASPGQETVGTGIEAA